MPLRSAKDQYSKDEIIEILKRNVALYKDEKEFVDYIVGLSMYLMDRHYDVNQRAQFQQGLQQPAAAPLPPPPPSTRMSSSTGVPKPLREDEMAPPRADDLRKRHTFDIDPLEEYLHNAPPPFSQTGTPPPSMPPPLPMPPAAPTAPRQEDLDEMPLDMDDPRSRGSGVYQVAGGLNTPPEGVLAPKLRKKPEPEEKKEEPPVKIENLGRTRVYRVVRSYKSPTAAENNCQVCGGMIPPDSKRCPNCGHVQ